MWDFLQKCLTGMYRNWEGCLNQPPCGSKSGIKRAKWEFKSSHTNERSDAQMGLESTGN